MNKLVQLKNKNNENIDPNNSNYNFRLQKLENKHKILYENLDGNNGDIEFTSSSSGASFLLVFWKSSYNLTRQGVVLAPNSGAWDISSFDLDANTFETVYQNNARYNISSTKMTLSSARNYNNQNNNTFYITKVVACYL